MKNTECIDSVVIKAVFNTTKIEATALVLLSKMMYNMKCKGFMCLFWSSVRGLSKVKLYT